jgi:hypothetical protein
VTLERPKTPMIDFFTPARISVRLSFNACPHRALPARASSLRQPNLSVHGVASALGISERYVHKLFDPRTPDPRFQAISSAISPIAS